MKQFKGHAGPWPLHVRKQYDESTVRLLHCIIIILFVYASLCDFCSQKIN